MFPFNGILYNVLVCYSTDKLTLNPFKLSFITRARRFHLANRHFDINISVQFMGNQSIEWVREGL